MALKTIEGYKDVDFKFDPIETADYSETNVKQDYGIISGAYEKSNTALTKFLDVARDIDGTLSKIGNTGISSSQLDATFDRVRQSLHDADFQLEMSNKYFKKLVDQELAEIEAANKAAAAALETAGGYGDFKSNVRESADHSRKAASYASQFMQDALGIVGNPVGAVLNGAESAKGYVTEQIAAGKASAAAAGQAGQAVLRANEKVGDYVYEHVTEPVANGVKTAVGNVKAANAAAGDYVYEHVTQPIGNKVVETVRGVSGGVEAGVGQVRDFAKGFAGAVRQGAEEKIASGVYAGK